MRIQLLSDLHLEFWRRASPSVRAAVTPQIVGDVLVLAGDIGVGTEGLDAFAGVDVPVIYLAGNHEFYGAHLNLMNGVLKQRAEELGFTYLDNSGVIIGGVRFLGCTLWTDFGFYPGRERQSMQLAKQSIRDFGVIRTPDGWFTPELSVLMHRTSVDWLDQELAQPFDGPTVVVTHHAPSGLSVAPRFHESPLNPVFVSEIDRLAGRASLWLHGHIHDSADYDWRGTRVVCNPRGYALRRGGTSDSEGGQTWENPTFDAGLVVRVGE